MASTPVNYAAGGRQSKLYALTLVNSGKTIAKDVALRFRVQLHDTRTGLPNLLKFSDDDQATSEITKVGDLAPNDEYEVTFRASVIPNPPTIQYGEGKYVTVGQYAKGAVQYVNPLTAEKQVDEFCMMQAGLSGGFSRCPTTIIEDLSR